VSEPERKKRSRKLRETFRPKRGIKYQEVIMVEKKKSSEAAVHNISRKDQKKFSAEKNSHRIRWSKGRDN